MVDSTAASLLNTFVSIFASFEPNSASITFNIPWRGSVGGWEFTATSEADEIEGVVSGDAAIKGVTAVKGVREAKEEATGIGKSTGKGGGEVEGTKLPLNKKQVVGLEKEQNYQGIQWQTKFEH